MPFQIEEEMLKCVEEGIAIITEIALCQGTGSGVSGWFTTSLWACRYIDTKDMLLHPKSKRWEVTQTFRHILTRVHPDKIGGWRNDLNNLANDITAELTDIKASLVLTIAHELDGMAEYPTNNQLEMISRMSKTNKMRYKYQGTLNAAGEVIGKTTRGDFKMTTMTAQQQQTAYEEKRAAWDDKAREWGYVPTFLH